MIAAPRRKNAPLSAADGEAIVRAIDVEGATWFALELRYAKQHNKLRAAYVAAKARQGEAPRIPRAA